MKRLWLLPALLVAILLVIFAFGARTWRGEGGGPRGEEGAEGARRRADAAARADDAASEPDGKSAGSATDAPPPVTFDGRLVYLDGKPAGGVNLHLAVGRPIEVRVFRNGEYTTKTVYLVVGHAVTLTEADGAFRFEGVPGASRARSFVYTNDDPQAFVVAEIFGGGETVRACRRIRVAGCLVGRDGKPLDDYWFEGRAGKPEDWQTRVLLEEDSFVAAAGDLEVDTLAINDARTGSDGHFSLVLAEGRNTLVFGDARSEGSIGIEVASTGPDLAPETSEPGPHGSSRRLARRVEVITFNERASGAMDAGELRVPGATLLAEEHELRGQILTLAGAPHAGCDVLAWDGSVGAATHSVTTDEQGAFLIEGLRSPNVILWAVPTERRHIDLPVQTSATIRMPCIAPVVLTAPSEEEYVWARVEVPGYYLFVRRDVFAAGEALDTTDVVGLPPGPLHIYLVTHRIAEATLDLGEPGEILLSASRFRDTTWE